MSGRCSQHTMACATTLNVQHSTLPGRIRQAHLVLLTLSVTLYMQHRDCLAGRERVSQTTTHSTLCSHLIVQHHLPVLSRRQRSLPCAVTLKLQHHIAWLGASLDCHRAVLWDRHHLCMPRQRPYERIVRVPQPEGIIVGICGCGLVAGAVSGVWRVVGALQTGMTSHATAMLQAPGVQCSGGGSIPWGCVAPQPCLHIVVLLWRPPRGSIAAPLQMVAGK